MGLLFTISLKKEEKHPTCKWRNPGFHRMSFWMERGWKVATSSRYNVNVKPRKKKKRLAPLRCQTGQSNHMVWAQTFISQIEIFLVSAEMSRCYPSPFLINSFVFLLDRYFFAQVTVDSTDGSRRSWLKSCSSVSQQNTKKESRIDLMRIISLRDAPDTSPFRSPSSQVEIDWLIAAARWIVLWPYLCRAAKTLFFLFAIFERGRRRLIWWWKELSSDASPPFY